MQQIIEWIEITKDNQPPHRECCYFLNEYKEIITGYYQVYDGKWIVVDPAKELTFKVPMFDVTYYAKVEE